jgi:Leucine-rich repeat (LRR) protein
LFLSENQFTGPIPAVIGNPFQKNGLPTLSPIKALYLSRNKLDGTIPSEICLFANLEALFLDENLLSGNIPPCIGDLEKLQQFIAFNNKLTGEVPSELGVLRNLTDIGIEQNSIVGDVPEEVCDLQGGNNTLTFWADCGGKSPELSCLCCSVCCPSSECV